MDKVSILIPARGEKLENLRRTIDSIKENATGDWEIIIGYDGRPDFLANLFGENQINNINRIKYILFEDIVGIKTNINAMAAMATGKYIYKSDAHCRFSKGFDEILQQDMQDDWIVTPRFKIIKDDWSIQMRDGVEEFYDYFYLCCPFTDPKGFRFKAGGHWPERTKEKLEKFDNSINVCQIDETPQIHGSGWFMTKGRFFELGGFPNIDPYGHAQEPIWLALKNWLMGGKIMVNKNCWYAHLHQQGNKRGYSMDKAQEDKSYKLAADYFVGDKLPDAKYKFEEFVSYFMPMPTWPENYQELIRKWQEENVK